MFWIQEIGTNKNNSKYKLFYAEEESDINNLPTQKNNGVQINGDTVSNCPVAAGSECVVLSTGNVYVLWKSTDTWTKFGGA